MCVLSDKTIKERLADGSIVLDPFNSDCLQPASYDLHLGPKFRTFAYSHTQEVVEPGKDQSGLYEEFEPEDGIFILHPGEFALGMTTEWMEFPDDLVGHLDGKSSLGRLGLLVHVTAGNMDPGFQGFCTLEFLNVIRLPIKLTVGMRIGHMSWTTTTTPVERPYGSAELGSHYQGQQGPEASRYHE